MGDKVKRTSGKVFTVGTCVHRITGTDGQQRFIGRIGIVKQPNQYNVIAGTFIVEYFAIADDKAEIDDTCHADEFQLAPSPAPKPFNTD